MMMFIITVVIGGSYGNLLSVQNKEKSKFLTSDVLQM